MKILVRLVTVSVVLLVALSGCTGAAQPAPHTPQAQASQPSPAQPLPTQASKASVAPVASPASTPVSDKPRSGGILPIALYLEPPGFDLHQQHTLASRMAAVPAYDGLLEYNQQNQNEIINDLAERYEVSKDGLEYTFHLQKGVKFHDGSTLTSEDVRFSLDRLLNPPKGVLSPRRELLTSIDKIETPDADTVKITCKYADASFLGGLALSQHVIYSRKLVSEQGDMKKIQMGTGPFKFLKYEPGVVLQHEKNKNYFRKDRPYLDGLVQYIIKDSATSFAAFRTGRVWMTSQGSGGLNPVQAELTEKELKGKAHAIRFIALSNTFAYINVSRRPLDDVRVRQALNLLADRPSIIKVAWAGEGVLGAFMVPEPYGKFDFPHDELLKMPGYRPDKAVDIAEARKLIADAGYDKGMTVKLVVRTVQTHQRTGEMLREQYKVAGIDLQLELLDTAIWTTRKTQEDYQLLLDPWGVQADDPSAWLEVVLNPDWSFKDAQLEQLKQLQSRTLDVNERRQIVQKIQLRLFDLMPVIPALRSGMWTMGIWDHIKNYGEPIGLYNSYKYTDVWLAQ